MKTDRIHPNLIRTVILGAMALAAGLTAIHADTYDVDVYQKRLTLYTDPYNGNEIKVGGFSGIYPMPGNSDRFFVITDRGPAPDYVSPSGRAYKTWAIPGFGPHIVTVHLQPTGEARIDEIMPLRTPRGGTEISGLPTTLPATDVPYDLNLAQLPYDEDSIDAEGITVDPWGNFWVCEEYKPSVAMVSRGGKVQLRLVPHGTLTGRETVPTYDLLPGVLAKRRNNRGFEGIAAAADGFLYAIVQRPLNNPNRAAADANGNARLVSIDLNALLHGSPGQLVRQFLYRMPAGSSSVTVSDLFSTSPTTLLVPERGTDKLYEIDIANATDITPLENSAGRLIADPTKTLEQLNSAGIAALGINPVTKHVVLNSLTAIDPLLEKCEGVCVVGNHLVFTYDNDFNVAEAGSTPVVPIPNGPAVEIKLLGNNLPKIFAVPLP